jgi:outer membrane autotransporter protein
MSKSTFKNKLLLTTAITTAAFSAGSAKATDINILAPSTTAQLADANGSYIAVTGSGNLTVTGAAYTAGAFTNLGVLVDTTSTSNGITATGLALDFTNAGSSIGYITANSGVITSSGATTVSIAGLADSYTITTGANGSITNSNSSGTVFAITGAAGTANQTVTVANSGLIDATAGNSNAFVLTDTNGGSSISVTNTGTISGNGTGNAFTINTSGGTNNGNDLTINNNGGTINGAIVGAETTADDITISSNTQGTIGNISGTAGNIFVTSNTDSNGATAGTATIGNLAVTTGGITVTANSGTIGNAAASGAAGTVTVTDNSGVIGNLSTTTGALVLAANSGTVGTVTASSTGAITIGGGTANSGTIGNVLGGGNVTITSAGGTIGSIENGGAGTLTLSLTDTDTGAITATGSGVADVTLDGDTTTGSVTLGSNASSTLVLNGTSSVNGIVVLNNAGQILAFNGGTVSNGIDGAGDIAVNANTAVSGAGIGGSTAVDDITIANTVTFDLATNNAALTADVITLSGATATLTMGTGTLTATNVRGGFAGQGVINFEGTNNIGSTVIGGTASVDQVNVNSGTVTTSAAITANDVTLADGANLTTGAGVLTADTSLGDGSTLTLGGAYSGAIDGSTAGNGAVIIAANQALGGNIGSNFDVASVTINNGVDVTNAADRSITTTGNLTLNGNSTLNVDDGVVTVGGDLNMGNGTMTTGAGLLTVVDAIVLDGTTLNIGSGSVDYGTIDGFDAAEGTLAFTAGTHNTTGEIGGDNGLELITVANATTLTIDENVTATDITIGGGASGSATISAGTTTGNINLDTDSTLTLSGTGTFAGTIDGDDGAVGGDVILARDFTTTANTIFGGTDGLTSLTVNATRTLTLNGANAGGDLNAADVIVNGTLAMGNAITELTGNLEASSTGVINLGNAAHTASGTFTTAAGSQISSTISAVTSGTTFTAGTLTAGTTAINDETVVNLTLASGAGYINDGASFTLVDAAAGTAPDLDSDSTQIRVNGATGANSNRTGVLTFDSTLSGANDLIIKVERTAYADVSTNAQADSVGAALNTIGGTATGELSELQTAADNATTSGALTDILDSATAQVDGGISEASVGTANLAIDAFGGRLSDIRNAFDSGVSSGDEAALSGVWVKAFGNTSSFDNDGGLKGYDANTAGAAIGADTALDDTTILGVGLAYSNSTVESNNNNKDTDAASYNLMVYGTKELGDNNYVDGFVSAGMNNYETSRFIATTGDTAKGDFDGTTYMARVSGGHRIDAGNGIEVVPNAGLTYGFSQFDSYTETGAGALNLNVDNDDITILQPKVGVDVAFKGGDANGIKFRPQFRVGYTYDALDNNQDTTSNFSGVATSFKTESADKDKSTFLIGTGVDIAGTENITLSADYDYQISSGYNSHNGMLNLRYGF